MPISPIVLQRRHAEGGRIRLGAKEGGNGRPMKLASFRFTSPSEIYIRDLAELYGGEPQAWDNSGKPEWEVYTTAKSIPVIAVKGGLSQWMETWSGGGCVHRCDGEKQVDGTVCDPNDRRHQDAKPTTRLSVMLPELDAICVWRMESHGWNAAAEIPAVAELAQFVGDLVPAVLNLVERRAIKDGKTSRFVVPVLDLRIGQARLREIVNEVSGGESLELVSSTPAAAAIEAPVQVATAAEAAAPAAVSAPQVVIPTPEQIAEADLAKLGRMIAYLEANAAGHPSIVAAKARANELNAVAQQTLDEDGAVDAEIVEDTATAAPSAAVPADPDAVWQQIVTVGGSLGMTLDAIKDDVAGRLGGVMAGEASAAELAMYLEHLNKQAAA